MEILKLLSHNILVEEEKIVENEITNNEEAKDFFNSIIDEVLKKETKKSYKPRVLTTEVISIITRVLKDMDSNEELLENKKRRYNRKNKKQN